jgi:hypothetical protein
MGQQMFAKNLVAFMLGVACQVLAGVFPALAAVFIAPASLLLSASDIRAVLDGSFIKHVTILILAIGCQAMAVMMNTIWAYPDAAAPLLAAGGLLMAASDIRRVLRGPEAVTAPMVTPDSKVTPPVAGEKITATDDKAKG